MSADNLNIILGWASFTLTLFIFSYLLGDNFLYRLAVSVLVGVTAAYVAIVAVESVIIPWVQATLVTDGDTELAVRFLGVIPFLLGILLIFKQLPRLAPYGNIGMAFIVGVGTAVAIAGAVAGTLLPIINDIANSPDHYNTADTLIMGTVTVCILITFSYLGRRGTDGQVSYPRLIKIPAQMGKGFLAITLGAIYGGVLITSLTVLSGVIAQQIRFLLEQLG